jgi:hypothetical protein
LREPFWARVVGIVVVGIGIDREVINLPYMFLAERFSWHPSVGIYQTAGS